MHSIGPVAATTAIYPIAAVEVGEDRGRYRLFIFGSHLQHWSHDLAKYRSNIILVLRLYFPLGGRHLYGDVHRSRSFATRSVEDSHRRRGLFFPQRKL